MLALAAGSKPRWCWLLILFAGQKLMRGWFHVVARRRSNELFVLNVLLITLGLAWATELAGLSLALGAFLAGMLISETEYRHQVEEDIKPFRDCCWACSSSPSACSSMCPWWPTGSRWSLLLFAAPCCSNSR